MQVQHTNLGTVLPLLEWLKYEYSKISEIDRHIIEVFNIKIYTWNGY